MAKILLPELSDLSLPLSDFPFKYRFHTGAAQLVLRSIWLPKPQHQRRCRRSFLFAFLRQKPSWCSGKAITFVAFYLFIKNKMFFCNKLNKYYNI